MIIEEELWHENNNFFDLLLPTLELWTKILMLDPLDEKSKALNIYFSYW